MRKRRIGVFWGLCWWIGVLLLSGQRVPYCSVVIDEQGNPLEFVNVVLYSLPDTVFVTGTITDQQGHFSLDATGQILQFSYVGYQTVYRKVSQLSQPILMKEESNRLSEVIVKATRPKHELTGNGISTKIKGTSLSLAGTANDVLRQLPMLQEEGEGFTVFGKGAPVIYINGRKLRDVSELEQIKSENIRDVEVVTDPGARYDASVKSVIRIRTFVPPGDGWGMAFYTEYFQAHKERMADQLDISFRKKHWDTFAMLRYHRNNYQSRSSVSQSVFVDTLWNQQNLMWNEGLSQQLESMAGFNYLLNDSNQWGTRLHIRCPFNRYEYSKIESMVFADRHFFDRWQNKEKKCTKSDVEYDYNLYYNGKIGRWSADFNFDALWSGADVGSEVNEESQEQDDRLVQSVNSVDNQLYAARMVVGHPLWRGNWYMGSEYTFVNRKDDYINKQQVVPTSYTKLKEHRLGTFMEYTARIPIGILKAGLRYEYVDFNYYEKNEYKPAQSRSYHQFFPSLSYATRLGKVELQLAYSSSVNRPSFSQLSNNVFYGNRYTLQTGNPLLKSSVSNNVGLMGRWKFLLFAANYCQENDAIIYAAEQLESNPAVTKVMFKNIDRLRTATIYVNASPEFGMWSPRFSVGMRKQWLDVFSNGQHIGMNRPLWNFQLNQTFKLPGGFLFMLNASYQTKGDYQNVYLNKSHYILDAAVTKTFCHKALVVQLKGYDLLDGYRDGNLLYNQSMQLNLQTRTDRRRVGVTIKYKFNVSKNKYKGGTFSQADKGRL